MRLRSLAVLLVLCLGLSHVALTAFTRVDVRGRVTTADADVPVRQALVAVWGERSGTLRMVMTDANGQFSFAGLPEDSYRVGATKRPHLAAFAAAEGAETVLRLARGSVVSGTVTDAMGAPASGISVVARGGAGLGASGMTDAQGQFRLYGLAAGAYTVTTDRAAQPAAITLGSGDEQQGIRLQLTPDPSTGAATGGQASLSGELLDRDSGEPLPNVGVVLAGPSTHRVTTDTAGAFRFTNVPVATYSVTVEDPAYRGIGSARIAPSSEPVVDIPLRAAKLGAVSGTVTDDAGDPFVGATITAFRQTEVGLRPLLAPAATAVTDDRGQYSMGSLPEGDYILCACGPNFPIAEPGFVAQVSANKATPDQVAAATQSLPIVPAAFHPGRGTTASASMVAINAGDMRPGVDINTGLVPARRVEGRLTAPDQRILARTTLRLLQSGSNPATAAVTAIEPEVISDEGAFTFPAVPEGDYTLTAISMEDDVAVFASVDVRVGGADTTGLQVPLRSGATIQGRIAFAGGTPVELPEGAQPQVSLAPVTLDGPSVLMAGISGIAAYHGLVGADGTFTITGVPAGQYVVTTIGFPSPWRAIDALGSTSGTSSEPVITLGDSDSQTVVLTMGEREPATLSGRVELHPFESPDGVRVALFPADEALWPQLYRTPSRVLFAPVNERFRFEFGDIPPGEYHAVVVRAGELEWSPRALARWAQRSERITLQSGEGPRIELSGR